MKKFMKHSLLGLLLLSSIGHATQSWTDNLGIYWVESGDLHPFRGSDVRTTTALSGTVTSTEQEMNRETNTWGAASDNDDLFLDTADGTWHPRATSYTYTITGSNHEIYEAPDGYVRLDEVVDIAGQSTQFGTCFPVPFTFSTGAKRYAFSWKNKEIYQLYWKPKNWQTNTTFSTLSDFVDAHNTFLENHQTYEHAGFRPDANLSDGSGDLVIIDDNNGSVGAIIGDWNASYTLPEQGTTSIKFTIDDSAFLDEDEDFKFATVENGEVWIGKHNPEGSIFETVNDGDFNGNEIAYNDYMNAVANYDFSQLVICDLKDKRTDITLDMMHLRTSYYGNMNFITEIETSPDSWQPFSFGTWSVENGIIINDSILNDINKTVSTDETDAALQNQDIIHTTTGRGDLVTQEGQLYDTDDVSPSDIPWHMNINDLKGKKVNLTYNETGEPSETGDVFLFPNMTFAFGDSGEDVGVWKVENGVIIFDSYWLGDDGSTVETDTSSWVFNDSTHANVYINNTIEANVTVNSVADITAADSFPLNFTADPVPYAVSVSDLAGKLVVVGNPADANDQDHIFFFANMTYKQESLDDQGNPETITGAWSVEEGVAVVDIVYSDNDSAHYVLTFDEAPAPTKTFSFMEVVGKSAAQGKETERETGIQIISISNIPNEDIHGVSPAIIMYLLN